MAATYDPNLGSVRDRLRFLLGDTDTGNPINPDETYDAVLAMHNNHEKRAALTLLDGMINRFAQLPNETATDGGQYRVKWTDRVKAWQELRARLAAELAAENPSPTAPKFPVSRTVKIRYIY